MCAPVSEKTFSVEVQCFSSSAAFTLYMSLQARVVVLCEAALLGETCLHQLQVMSPTRPNVVNMRSRLDVVGLTQGDDIRRSTSSPATSSCGISSALSTEPAAKFQRDGVTHILASNRACCATLTATTFISTSGRDWRYEHVYTPLPSLHHTHTNICMVGNASTELITYSTTTIKHEYA